MDIDGLAFFLPPRKSNIGNPTLPAIHGGAVGGFMELAAALHLMKNSELLVMPKVVDFSLDYLRPSRFKNLYARCVVNRYGAKLVNVSVDAWQDNEQVPVAKARAQFLVG